MRRILVPTDFSDFAQEALRYAVALRRRTGAEVHLLHVVSPTPPAPEALDFETGPPEDGLRAALRLQAEVAGTTASDLTCAIRYAYAIAPEILTYLDEVDADTIVVGTHGKRGLRRLMLGSVAEELVRTSPCDVLVSPLRTTPFSAHPARRILVPLDMREGSDALLAHTRDFARSLGASQVDILHVLEPLPYPVRWLDEAILDIVPSIRDRAAESLRDLAKQQGLEEADVYVERGRPENVIRRVADVLDSDLIVVAPHQQARVVQALLGSVAGEVARTAERPVLVARSLITPEATTASGAAPAEMSPPLV